MNFLKPKPDDVQTKVDRAGELDAKIRSLGDELESLKAELKTIAAQNRDGLNPVALTGRSYKATVGVGVSVDQDTLQQIARIVGDDYVTVDDTVDVVDLDGLWDALDPSSQAVLMVEKKVHVIKDGVDVKTIRSLLATQDPEKAKTLFSENRRVSANKKQLEKIYKGDESAFVQARPLIDGGVTMKSISFKAV